MSRRFLAVGFVVTALLATTLVAGTATAQADPDPASGIGLAAMQPSATAPIRAAFFYPWFPNAWRQNGVEPFTNFTPTLGTYDSRDDAIIDEQLALARQAHISVFISSWWGPGHHTDDALGALLETTAAPASPHPDLDWAVYYEEEGQSDPSSSAIAADLAYLRDNYFSHDAYLKIDGKPVVFVWTTSRTDGEEMLVRWKNAQTILGEDIYIVPKVFSGYRDSSPQPESWHQYGPATSHSDQRPFSWSVSPGFWLHGEAERLPRDLDRFEADVIEMNNARTPWQLITSWNEWGEGTSIEPALEWGNDYIDVLADNPPPGPSPTPQPLPREEGVFTFTAGGDQGVNSRADHILGEIGALAPAFHLALGDLSYSNVPTEQEWCDYVESHLGSTPMALLVGNHEDDDRHDGYIGAFADCMPDRFASTGVYGAEYYFDVDDLMRIIMIGADNDVGGIRYDYVEGNERYEWLEDAIDDARADGIRWITVGMHKPCITAGRKSCEIGQDVIDLLLDKRVDLILHGHDHNYQRSKQLSCALVNSYVSSCVADDGADGMYEQGRGSIVIVSGLMGTGNYDIDPTDPEFRYFAETMDDGFGFLQVTASDAALDVEFVGTWTGYHDRFTIAADPPPTSPSPTATAGPTAFPTGSPCPEVDWSSVVDGIVELPTGSGVAYLMWVPTNPPGAQWEPVVWDDGWWRSTTDGLQPFTPEAGACLVSALSVDPDSAERQSEQRSVPQGEPPESQRGENEESLPTTTGSDRVGPVTQCADPAWTASPVRCAVAYLTVLVSRSIHVVLSAIR